jgi:ribosomal protein S18 acetylase RimI-like enzyme
MLYVEGDNDRAIRLYERFGFRTAVTNAVYARPASHTR